MTASNLLETLPLQDKAVAVAGLFRTRSGLGRGARLMVSDLRRRGYAVNAVDLSALLYLNLDDSGAGLLLPSDLERLSVRELLIHVNPPLFSEALKLFPEAVLRRVRVIGYWTWELTTLTDDWRACARACAALWAPSPFVAETLAAELPDFTGDIVVVPHQVDLDPPPRLDASARRQLRRRHGFGPEDFVCGTTFAYLSNYTRKNPMGAIDAFTRAFPAGDHAAKLLVRAWDCANYPELHGLLLNRAKADPRIVVFDAAEHPWPIKEFLNVLDVFLALHRAEGYGLQMAEAAQAGTPVLATAWGLAPDIAARVQVHQVNFELVAPRDPQGFYSQWPNARWAEPDLDHAAQHLRALRASHAAQKPRDQATYF